MPSRLTLLTMVLLISQLTRLTGFTLQYSLRFSLVRSVRGSFLDELMNYKCVVKTDFAASAASLGPETNRGGSFANWNAFAV